jgi:DNA repair protein RadC
MSDTTSSGTTVRVSDLPRGLQPREKLQKQGERSLSHSELMAIVLGSGTRAINVLKIADSLLRKYGFDALPNISIKEWQTNRGIGLVKACQLKAFFELGRRSFAPKDDERPALSGPKEAYAQVKDLRRARKEHLVALYLDSQNRLLARETIAIGSLNTTRTHPREILQPAIACSALGFILVHNHPSGSLTPSQDDVDFTRAIKRACEIIGIGLYDHLIVSANGFVSLKEKGLL